MLCNRLLMFSRTITIIYGMFNANFIENFQESSSGYVKGRPFGETLPFTFSPNKIGQKLAEIWGVQYNPLN